MPTTNPPRGHIRTLDGLRGVAILMVLMIHFYPKWLIADAYPTLTMIVGRIVEPGGYGVELFFVLSGFLITGILLDTKGERGFLVKFYMRRTLRIFPLYYAALAVTLLIVPGCVTLDEGAKAIVAGQLRLWTYTMNWPSGWVWDDSGLFKLGHFWSLCVEEHFYLFWPAIIALLPRPHVFKAAAGMVGAGLACRGLAMALGDGGPELLHWLTLQRIDGLAVGALVATAVRDPALAAWAPEGMRHRRRLLLLGAASLGYVLLPRRVHFPIFDVFGETIIVAFFGLVLLSVLRLQASDRLHRTMTSRTLVTFGKYSYGLYVIHGIMRPVFERSFGFQSLPAGHGLAFLWMPLYYVLATAISLGLAWASYEFFEKRFLDLKRRFAYARDAAPAR